MTLKPEPYIVREVLGSHPLGLSTVVRAWDPRRGEDIALKTLAPHLAADRAFAAGVLEDAHAFAQAARDHPALLQIHEARLIGAPVTGAHDAEQPVISMEVIRGEPLGHIARADLPLATVVALISPIADALDRLHQAGQVHGNLTAGNAVRTADGRVVLMDRGISARVRRSRHAPTGVYVGRPEYTTPDPDPLGPAADIYALGVLTFHLLTGAPPFTGDGWWRVCQAHYEASPPPLWELRPDLPNAVYAAVLEALAKHPARRPATAGAFARALGGATPQPMNRTTQEAAQPANDPHQTLRVVRPPPEPDPPLIEARVGETVRVKLARIPHPGAQFNDPQPPPVLRYIRREWEPTTPGTAPPPGDWGYAIFVFEAVAAGEGPLSFTYGGGLGSDARPDFQVRIYPADAV